MEGDGAFDSILEFIILPDLLGGEAGRRGICPPLPFIPIPLGTQDRNTNPPHFHRDSKVKLGEGRE